MKQIPKDKLNIYAQLIRKYNLGDNFLYSKFFQTYSSDLDDAWHYARKKIQNKEIIKDVQFLDLEDLKTATDKMNSIGKNPDSIYRYLETDFNEKQLKLKDENIERRVRHLLALKYIEVSCEEIRKKERRTERLIYTVIVFIIISIFAVPRIIEGLTPVEKLANKYHEKSKYKYRVGAVCRDGTHSSSTGRGTCSHHGGVEKWIYQSAYSKSMEECREKAKKRSWRD